MSLFPASKGEGGREGKPGCDSEVYDTLSFHLLFTFSFFPCNEYWCMTLSMCCTGSFPSVFIVALFISLVSSFFHTSLLPLLVRFFLSTCHVCVLYGGCVWVPGPLVPVVFPGACGEGAVTAEGVGPTPWEGQSRDIHWWAFI